MIYRMDKISSLKDNPGSIVLSIILLSVFMLFYIPLIRNWFFSDDIQWIWSSATTHIHEIFFVPERSRAMASNFTPMLGLSFRTDWLLFGMNPSGYAVHSLLMLAGAVCAFYFFLRLYVSREYALAGDVLLMVNPITLSITSWLSARHYVEGLFWALLSLYLFVRAERRGETSLSAGIFYLLAALSKEVYVVLPAVSFLISEQKGLKRIKNTLPLWCGLVIYSVWRLWIMGGIGGYPSNQPLSPGVMIPIFLKTIKFLSIQWFGNYSLFLYPILLLVLIASLKDMRILYIFLVLIIPILPVSNLMNDNPYTGRYFFHISVFLISVLCIFFYHVTRSHSSYKNIAFIMLLLIFAMCIRQDVRLSQVIREERLMTNKTAVEFVNSDAGYVNSRQPMWFYEGLRNIYKTFFAKKIKTQLVPPETFLKYADPEKLTDIKASGISIPYDEIIGIQKTFRTGPISIRLTMDNYRFTWDFGPYKDKIYTMLRSPVSGLYYNKSDLRPTGSYMLGKDGRDDSYEIVYIRIFYRSEDGGEVISPEFQLRIPGTQAIEFSRTM